MDSETSPHKVTVKFKDEATEVIQKFNENFNKVSELLKENNRLLLEFIRRSFEVV